MDKVPFDCPALDQMLDGGVEPSCMTLIYGEAGTGKTNLCLILARNVARTGKKVVYIDTEGVSLDRLRQMCGADYEEVLRRILLSEVSSFDEQEKMVDKAIKMAEGNLDVGLLIVDSMTMYYRLTSRGEERSERKSLTSQSVKLLGVARKMGIPVVITSQVYTDVETGRYEALGGHPLHHNAKTILRVDKAGVGKRKVTVMKHRHIEEGKGSEFRLTGQGISCE